MNNDIKEIKDIMAMIKLLAVSGAKIGKDGKVGPDDLMHLLDLLKEADKFKAAFDNIKDVPSEVKDINEAEALELVAEVFGIVKSIKEVLA